MTAAPHASFEAPWHGQVFALAVSLSEAGHFAWPEWTEMFGAALKKAGQNRQLDGSDDYYGVWVGTLEDMMIKKHMADPSLLMDMKTCWQEAFLSTPHGKPVIPKNRPLMR